MRFGPAPLGGMASGGVRARSGRRRWSFDRPVVLRAAPPNVGRESGRHQGGRVSYLAASADGTRPDPPDFAPPASAAAAPVMAGTWISWWPDPPDDPPASYMIPDPPTGDPPLEATATRPVIFRVRAGVGSSSWDEIDVYELWARADIREVSGGEAIRAGADITRTRAVVRIQAADIDWLLDNSPHLPAAARGHFSVREWSMIDPSADEDWDMQSAARSWDRGRTLEIVAERRL